MTFKEGEGMGHHTRKDVLHTFQMNFFAMSLLNTFPWDASKTLQHALNALRNYLRLFPTGDAVSLAENVALISQGTTGLVTWEAALYLSEWALENTHIFKNKTVLELGSGIGLIGIVVCRSSSLTKYIFSDCHQTVLQRLKDNIKNCLTNCDSNRTSVCVEELDWENVSDEQLQEYRPAPSLLLSRLLNCKVQEEHPDVYIASTVRNPQTYDCLKTELGRFHIINNILFCYTVDVKCFHNS
uniref:Eukaryotic elongation factor 2 lysine methyltransferase n=1 Tax=Sinocyclocheilus grahami TaxID=75366 RepID=A0A672P7F8_SINGR